MCSYFQLLPELLHLNNMFMFENSTFKFGTCFVSSRIQEMVNLILLLLDHCLLPLNKTLLKFRHERLVGQNACIMLWCAYRNIDENVINLCLKFEVNSVSRSHEHKSAVTRNLKISNSKRNYETLLVESNIRKILHVSQASL